MCSDVIETSRCVCRLVCLRQHILLNRLYLLSIQQIAESGHPLRFKCPAEHDALELCMDGGRQIPEIGERPGDGVDTVTP